MMVAGHQLTWNLLQDLPTEPAGWSRIDDGSRAPANVEPSTRSAQGNARIYSL